MKRYVVKNEKNKTYKNMFGVTDYDIPMFGFKSALLILGATMLSLIVLSDKEALGHAMGKEFRASLAVQDANFAQAIMKVLGKEGREC